MATSPTAQNTDFSRDVLGRYVCNGLDEALLTTDTNRRPDARPFDVVVIGGGSFGPVLAQHLFAADKTKSYRTLVLEGGRFLIPGHVQNVPLTGLGVPGPTLTDPGTPRAEVWGLPWRSDIAFPGLAYCLGGRSLYFGGWSPQLLSSELPAVWPAALVSDLAGPLPGGGKGYFAQAAEQIGTNVTNDFILGPLHDALRAQLRAGLDGGKVPEAIPLAQLPSTLDDVAPADQDLFKLEAPLAVQGRSPRSGAFGVGKFSSVPLLIQAARAAQDEYGDDVKKRLMVVPNCHVTRLITDGSSLHRRVVAVETNQGTIPVPLKGVVILALGTIESARLALASFPGAPHVGANLMAHLRSNLTIRIPRTAIAGLDPAIRELSASALFVKGRHHHADGLFGHFHLQITASGLAQPSTNSEAELFRAIPDLDTLDAFRHITDDHVVLTIRGIGEMRPGNAANAVTLSGQLDEFGVARAAVTLVPSADDVELWDAMDAASDQVARVFAGAENFDVLGSEGVTFVAVTPATNLRQVLPYTSKTLGGRRDGMGTTHHEAGVLRIGDNPDQSVLDANARFHQVTNAYAVGPSTFPTVGSPNPMLTGVALARRLADGLAAARPAFQADPGFTALFDGTSTRGWRMSTIRNQPGRNDPGRFLLVDGSLEAVPGSDIGLLWHTAPTPDDFILRLEWRRSREDDNSGVFVRFPAPDGRNYDNTAFVAADFGFEVQIDQIAAADGAGVHRTAAIYGFQGPANADSLPVNPPGTWNAYEIAVQGQTYTVTLNGTVATTFTFTAGSDPVHPDRGLTNAPRFVGLQTHTGRVSFRRIQIRPV
jgi:choline dehydrogenase-like flavoprotein